MGQNEHWGLKTSTVLAPLSAVELPYTHTKENAPHKEWHYQEVWLCWRKCVTVMAL